VVLGEPSVPLEVVPLEDVPVPADVPDPLVPDEAPDEPEPLDPPDEPPLWASADAGNVTAARRRAKVLSFMGGLRWSALGFPQGQTRHAHRCSREQGIRGGRNLRFIPLFTM
jgi:hypothetical protein